MRSSQIPTVREMSGVAHTAALESFHDLAGGEGQRARIETLKARILRSPPLRFHGGSQSSHPFWYENTAFRLTFFAT